MHFIEYICVYPQRVVYLQYRNSQTMKTQLKSEIEKLAKKSGLTFIQACQFVQTEASKKGKEDIIELVHEIKMESFYAAKTV